MSSGKRSPLVDALLGLIPLAVSELAEAIPRWRERRAARRARKEAERADAAMPNPGAYPPSAEGQNDPER